MNREFGRQLECLATPGLLRGHAPVLELGRTPLEFRHYGFDRKMSLCFVGIENIGIELIRSKD